MKIVLLENTSSAFPAQWEGKLANGTFIYIRFRHGRLTLQLGKDRKSPVRLKPLLEIANGFGLRGDMDDKEMKETLDKYMKIEWPDKIEAWQE